MILLIKLTYWAHSAYTVVRLSCHFRQSPWELHVNVSKRVGRGCTQHGGSVVWHWVRLHEQWVHHQYSTDEDSSKCMVQWPQALQGVSRVGKEHAVVGTIYLLL